MPITSIFAYRVRDLHRRGQTAEGASVLRSVELVVANLPDVDIANAEFSKSGVGVAGMRTDDADAAVLSSAIASGVIATGIVADDTAAGGYCGVFAGEFSIAGTDADEAAAFGLSCARAGEEVVAGIAADDAAAVGSSAIAGGQVVAGVAVDDAGAGVGSSVTAGNIAIAGVWADCGADSKVCARTFYVARIIPDDGPVTSAQTIVTEATVGIRHGRPPTG